MADQSSSRPDVFVCYSHKDAHHLARLQVHLAPFEQRGVLSRWDDTDLRPGSAWRQEIERALDAAQVAILLVSADFLASKFISEVELPTLLLRAKTRGLTILPVILSPCAYVHSPLAGFQAVNSPDKSITSMSKSRREQVWKDVAEEAAKAIQRAASEDRNGPDTEGVGTAVRTANARDHVHGDGTTQLGAPKRLRLPRYLYVDGDFIRRLAGMLYMKIADNETAEAIFDRVYANMTMSGALINLTAVDKHLYEEVSVGDLVEVRLRAKLPEWEQVVQVAETASAFATILRAAGQGSMIDTATEQAISGIKQIANTRAAETTTVIGRGIINSDYQFVAELSPAGMLCGKGELETDLTIVGTVVQKLAEGQAREVFRLMPKADALTKMNREQRRRAKANKPGTTDSPYDEVISYPAMRLIPLAIFV